MHQLDSGDPAPGIAYRLEKRARPGGRGVLTGGDIWLNRFITVEADPNLHARVCAFAERGPKRFLQRIAEPHIVNGKIESPRGATEKSSEPFHDGVGRLFALGEKEN